MDARERLARIYGLANELDRRSLMLDCERAQLLTIIDLANHPVNPGNESAAMLLLKRVAAECRETFLDTDEMAPAWVSLLADIDAATGYQGTDPAEPAPYDGLPEYLASPYTPRDSQ